MATLQFVTAHGHLIEPHLDQLGQLRIAVFRDFPYLYEGTAEYERAYLDVYLRTPESLLFAVYDGGQMVGATTALPLAAETKEIQEPWLAANIDVSTLFYFGESILLPPYRGMGLGHRFFDEREGFMRAFGKYHISTFCSVNRPFNHTMKPADYRPNDVFWKKRGYTQVPDLQCSMEWQDIGEQQPTSKTLTFWMKKWN